MISKKTKQAILVFTLSIIVGIIIVFAGAFERGYFWPASEIFILPMMWIGAVYLLLKKEDK